MSQNRSGRRAATRSAWATPSLLSDFLTTSATQGLSLLLNAASLAAISRRLGELDLGLYTLERRSMMLIQPFVLLGLTVATPRYLALARGERRGHRDFTVAGVSLVLLIAGTAALLMFTFAAPIAAIAFGDRREVGLTRALAGFVFVTAAYQAAYSIFRGRLEMIRANLLELTVVGALPLLLGLVGPRDIVLFMWLLNGGIAASTILSAFGVQRSLPSRHEVAAAIRHRSRQLLHFGLARTPGDIAAVALFSIGPLSVVQWGSAREAGYISIVQSSLNVVGFAAVPLGVLLLPRVAVDMAVHGGGYKKKYAMLADATLDASVGLAGVVFIASPALIYLWLPSMPEEAIVAERVAALGLPGYVFYLIFRSYLDAVDERPVSSIATLTGLATLVVMLGLVFAVDAFSPTVSASVALSAALAVTGFVTLRLVRRRLGEIVDRRSLALLSVAFAAMVAIGLAVRGMGLPAIGAASALTGLAYVATLALARRPWMSELALHVRRLRAQSGPP